MPIHRHDLRLIFAAIPLLMNSLVFAADTGQPPPTLHATADYQVETIEGWTVRLSPTIKSDEKLCREGLTEIARQLREVERLLPAKAVEKLKGVPIWVDSDGSDRSQYHPEKKWLASHGYNPDKARGIEIGNLAHFIRKPLPGRHVLTLLHELAHAYHDQVLGFDQPDVIKAYDAAVAGKKYESVLRDTGGMTRHYALTDPKEYFAECSEAYFGVNDYYPFIRIELKQFDPQIHDLLGRLWSQTDTAAQPKDKKPG